MNSKNIIIILMLQTFTLAIFAQTESQFDGSELWFANSKPFTENPIIVPSSICIQEISPTFSIIEKEIQNDLNSIFNKKVIINKKKLAGCIFVGTSKLKELVDLVGKEEFAKLGVDGFIIKTIKPQNITIIAANTDIGALYGTFHYVRILRTTNTVLNDLNITEVPDYKIRILNHWDNLDGTVERGYAGHSIWKWDELPNTLSPRYKAYARANASIGINATVLNNVNANPKILADEYLNKVQSIANEIRPYGIKVFLAVNFSSPKELGKLATSDPLDKNVQDWWKNKVKEVYALIPDFGGFLVKANSEGLPGPQDFGRTHADGANMLADALKPYGGIVMWRAFVYKPNGIDRAKQAYEEFLPLDGKFRKNVIIQVKNGPVDFQPREPFSPLFGAMKHTSLMSELQITQEYLGFSDHLVYLGTLFKEFLDADTYTEGRNSTITRITDGSVFNDSITAIAGVANIGLDTNWCGHHFAQANWYAFGRLAWDHQLSAKEIANEWLKQTFTGDNDFVEKISKVMMQSREALVNYMTPIGLHHLMGWSHHFGPEPWCNVPGARADWMPSYYHKADSLGIGFDRSSTGSNATSQYAEPLKSMFDNPAICPPEYLLWFHHLPWNYVLPNGNELWDELCYKYSSGVNQVKQFQKQWDAIKGKVDEKRFFEVQKKLTIQSREAIWWRDACLLYFQSFSQKEIPIEFDRPIYLLDKLKEQKFQLKNHN